MRRIGKVTHITDQGSVIVRTDRTPPMGAKVVDKRVNEVGVIVDVFGPVKEPYVAIRPAKGVEVSNLVDQVLYLYERRTQK